MKKINDSSYKKLFIMKKYKDLYDFSSLECRVALCGTIILDVIFSICSLYLGKNDVINCAISLLDEIGIALIGFIGFTVSALAILTGVISSKVVNALKKRDKMIVLERILLSFYLMGMVCAIVVLFTWIIFFLVQIPINSIFFINLLSVSALSYFTLFILFYAVKLIGNCLELFYIVNEFELIDESKVDYKEKYNNYRITALEIMNFKGTSMEQVNAYKNEVKRLILEDECVENEKEILLKMHEQHFSN